MLFRSKAVFSTGALFITFPLTFNVFLFCNGSGLFFEAGLLLAFGLPAALLPVVADIAFPALLVLAALLITAGFAL